VLGSVLLKSIRDLRRGFAWWALGLVGYVALIVSVYPTVRDNPELDELVESYPEALKAFIAFGGQFDFTSAAGYLGSELFSFMMPAIFLVASVGNGAGSIAGEEERGTLDLLLSAPLSRARIALEKLGAMCLELAGLGVVLWLALWIGAQAFSMHVSAGRLAAATALLVVLAIAYGAIAFMLAGATGRKGLAVGVTVALAVAAYLVNSLAGLVDALEPFQKVTPFYHYAASDPLHQGLDPWHTLFLLAAGAAASAVGVFLFGRRDVGSSS
jgi:ABC-2 type transport system permease protein